MLLYTVSYRYLWLPAGYLQATYGHLRLPAGVLKTKITKIVTHFGASMYASALLQWATYGTAGAGNMTRPGFLLGLNTISFSILLYNYTYFRELLIGVRIRMRARSDTN